MKKTILALLAITLVTAFNLGLSSCGSDDEEESQVTSPIVGTWKVSANTFSATITFTTTGKVTLVTKDKSKVETVNGTYEISSGPDYIVKLLWEDNTREIWEVTISGNTMNSKSVSGTSTIKWTKQ